VATDTASLTRHPLLWRGKQATHHITALASGYAALDAALPGGGWALGALTELIHAVPGCGELSLLLPALAQLGRKNCNIVMIDPPWVPYPPALHDRGLTPDSVLLVRTHSRSESLWACQQVLRDMPGAAVLAWPDSLPSPGTLSFSELRRLQLAAEIGQKAAFLFRNARAANTPSPAALRLQLTAAEGDLQVRVLKCRGQRTAAAIYIRRSQLLQPLMPPLVSSSGSSKRSSSSSDSPLVSLATSRIGRPSL